jgi:tetratricopeptide (TPR) repeat protein
VQGLALHNRSESYRELGQYLAAKKAAEESLALIRLAGYRVGEANTLENLAMIEFSLEERAQAFAHVQHALAIAREVAARRVEVSILTRIGFMQLQIEQLDAAEQAFLEALNIERQFEESIPMFELQAGLAGLALARAGAESLEQAQSYTRELTAEILRDPPTEQSHILPMGLYLICIRVAQACNDPCLEPLITRAKKELWARFAKITDLSLRPAYMGILEHREIMSFAGARA